MKRLFLVLMMVLLSGCATYIPLGRYYVDGKQGVKAYDVEGKQMGRACMKSILALVATGDASIAAAKANGGITKVESIHYEVENLFGVVGEYCTVVVGT